MVRKTPVCFLSLGLLGLENLQYAVQDYNIAILSIIVSRFLKYHLTQHVKHKHVNYHNECQKSDEGFQEQEILISRYWYDFGIPCYYTKFHACSL